MRTAPRVPSQQRRSRRRLVHRIALTEPANPVHGRQTLFKGVPPAIRGFATNVIGAPLTTVIRLSGLFDADDSCESAHNNEQKPHVRLLTHSLLNPSAHTLFQTSRNEGPGSQQISPSCWFSASGASLTEVIAARSGTDWVHRTRPSRACQPDTVLMWRTGTAG